MPDEAAGPVTVQIAPCGVCHALFLLSEARSISPCHGADPLIALATLAIGPDGTISGQWGVPSSPVPPEPVEEPAPPPVPPEEDLVGAVHEPPPPEVPSPLEVATREALAFLRSPDADSAAFRDALLDAGADQEDAAAAAGRLDAVRSFLRQLEANS